MTHALTGVRHEDDLAQHPPTAFKPLLGACLAQEAGWAQTATAYRRRAHPC
jgi:hypothetical protein